MKKYFVFFSCLISTVVTLSAGEIVLSENGKAKADIVVPDKPSTYVKFAAKELKHYLDKITGADFKITSQPVMPVRIYLGQSPKAKAAGLNPEKLKQDGFFISAKGNDIFIVGLDNKSVRKLSLFHLMLYESRRATLLGVYEFLEQLGVRWPAPGPDNECVPNIPKLKIQEGFQKIEPFYPDRQLTGLWNFMKRFADAEAYCNNSNDTLLWGIRLKQSARLMVPGCHTEQFLRLNEIWGDHPERFQLMSNGKRNMRHLCWSDPAVLKIWEKAADTYFSGGKPSDIGLPGNNWRGQNSKNEFMVDPMDFGGANDGRCRCERCNALRKKYPCKDDSEIIWKVIVNVTESIKSKYPGKFISTLVYPPKLEIPKYVKIPDNVRVRICIIGPGALPTPKLAKSELNIVKHWSKVLGNNKPPLWTYQCRAAFGRQLPGVPETYPHLISGFLTSYRNYIAGMYFEQEHFSHTCRNLDAYIAAKLLWNPNLDIDALLKDYFKSYYGPGAEPARKLFQRLENNWIKCWKLVTPDLRKSDLNGLNAVADKELQKRIWSKVYTPEEIKKINAMLSGLEKVTAGNPVYAKRVGLIRKWVFDSMKVERAEVMDIAGMNKKIITVPESKNMPAASDWAKAPAYNLVSALRRKSSLKVKSTFKILCSGNTLFLKAELKEPHLNNSLTLKERQTGDKDVWKDNDLEIFLYSDNSGTLWQIIVNDQGKWASQRISNGKSEWIQMKDFQVKVYRSADGWNVDAAIPLKQTGGYKSYFNLTRSRKIKGWPNELATWSPLAKVGHWHDFNYYGILNIIPESKVMIRNIKPQSGKKYKLISINIGEKLYIDRDYTIKYPLPREYENLAGIRSAMQDRNFAGNNFLKFEISRDGIVYLGYSAGSKTKPDWMKTFKDTGKRIYYRGYKGVTESYKIYSKFFKKGKVTLGGVNKMAGMYLVFVGEPQKDKLKSK